METILIIGTETVVGANLAATLADRFRIIGLSRSAAVDIAGCENDVCRDGDYETVREWVASEHPDRIIFAGHASRSSWDQPGLQLADDGELQAAENWARAAAEFECHFTCVSSDGIFTSPWMFHEEDCTSLCNSKQAATIRNLEQRIRELCPQSLIVRTHAYGWLPQAVGQGWLERTLTALEARTATQLDHFSHATPILATDLAELLVAALEHPLTGTYHIAGAERVNAAAFVQKLADTFQLPSPRRSAATETVESAAGFGRGEMALQTRKIRQALGTALPMLNDGLSRLSAQLENGYRERVDGRQSLACERVA